MKRNYYVDKINHEKKHTYRPILPYRLKRVRGYQSMCWGWGYWWRLERKSKHLFHVSCL